MVTPRRCAIASSLLDLIRNVPSARRWYMRVPEYSSPDGANKRDLAVELFAKPDDRWEVNDVADRCSEVVELLTAVLDAASSAEAPTSPAPLAEILTERLD